MQGFPRQGLPDLPVVQQEDPVRRQGDALQNVGGKQQGSVVPVAPDLLVQVFRAGEVQAVDRLVQEKQFGFQGKGGDEKGFPVDRSFSSTSAKSAKWKPCTSSVTSGQVFR